MVWFKVPTCNKNNYFNLEYSAILYSSSVHANIFTIKKLKLQTLYQKMGPMFKNVYQPFKLTVIFFKFLQIILGYDFGYFKYNSIKIKFIVRLLGVLQSVFISALYFYTVYYQISVYGLFWFYIYLVQYMLYILIFSFDQSDASLCRFQYEINEIDVALKCNSAQRSVQIRKQFVLFLLNTYEIGIFIAFFRFHGIFKLLSWPSTIVYYSIVLSLEYVTVANIFIFYAVYYRLCIFVKKLKTVNNEVDYYRRLYKLIAEVIEKYKKLFDPIVSILSLYEI